MQKNSQDFNLQEALRLAKSPAGQQLLAMFQRSDADKLKQAADQANAGNYTQAMVALNEILSSPEGQKLLKELGR